MPRPINIAGFNGSNLAVNERLLDESVGVSVIDAEPGRGDLRPLRAALPVATVPASPQRQTIYRFGRLPLSDSLYWFSWSSIVHAVLGFDGLDTTERTYFTGAGTPKWTNNILGIGSPPYPQAARELAVPAPTTPALTLLVTDGPVGGTQGARFYVHTFVNDLGWESAPSPVSAGLTCLPGAQIDITNLEPAPAGNYGITLRRIYRTQPGVTGETEFFFLREIAVSAASTTDDGRQLEDQIESEGWVPPPAGGFGLTALWSGMFGMLSGKTAHICVPNTPYAYPERYDIQFFDTPVASVKWGQSWLVLTTGTARLIQGQDPESLVDTPLALSAPCVAARSAVSFVHGGVWASPEGLAYAGEAGQALLTGPTPVNPKGIFTDRQWKALRPETIVAGRYGRLYVAFYNDGTGSKGFMIDPLNPGGGVWFLRRGYDACYYDELADALFVLDGGSILKFDAGAARLLATFSSKTFRQTAPTNFAWGKVVASAYPVTLRVYCDGVLRTTREVESARAFALTGGFVAEDWRAEVDTTSDVQIVRLANSVRELKGV